MILVKRRSSPYYLVLLILLIYWNVLSPIARANSAGDLDNLNVQHIELYLELVINGYPTSQIVAVDYEQPDFYIAPQDLTTVGISADHWQQLTPRIDGKIALTQIEHLTVSYQQDEQQLLISVPPAWLPQQMISTQSAQTYYPAQNSQGVIFNYDAYVSKQKQGNGYIAIGTDLRVFGDYGIWQSTGSYHHQFDQASHKYTRYDTYWQYSDQQSITTWDAGDLVTRTLSWGDPVRLGGVQVSQNFSIRPDIITYPLPELAGENSLPSTVDLLVNGYQVDSTKLNAGPFTLTNIPFINGAGEATIITTDTLGRQVSTTVPLYVTSHLLKKGLVDYSLAAGLIRQKYGVSNFSYHHPAMSGNYRYGLTDYFTTESHLEADKDLQQLGLGSTLRLGIFGVFNSSYSQSHYDSHAGRKITFGYQYDSRLFNVAMQYNDVNHQYRSLSNLEYGSRIGSTTRQVTFGLPLGKAGNLVAGYFKVTSQHQSANELMNLSWNRSFKQFGNAFFSISKSNRNDNWTGFLQWMLPLNQGRDNLSVVSNRDAQKQYTQRVNYNHMQPNEGGWGWNMGYQSIPRQDDYYQADLAWRNQSIELYGGAYGTGSNSTWWGNTVGSLILMDNQIYAANSVQDSFVAISTDHVPNVSIFYENTLIGETNNQGYLLLTKIPAYYAAKYSVDPFTLDENSRIHPLEQKVAVKSKNGYILPFKIEKITPTNLILVDQQHQALPLGSEVTINQQQVTYVGWDGFVYFDHIKENNELSIVSPEQVRYQCSFPSSLTQENSDQSVSHILICYQEGSQ